MSSNRPITKLSNGNMRKASNGNRTASARPPSSKLSRPGDVARSSRPPASVLSRPGDIAKSSRPSSSVLSRPGDVVRTSNTSRSLVKSRPRVNEVRRSNKRKSASPSVPTFGSSSEGEDEDDFDEPQSAKKPRTLGNEIKGDPNRSIRDVTLWVDDNNATFPIIHGADLALDEGAKDFQTWFETEQDESVDILLQYPNATQQERFCMLAPKKDDGYRPHEDVCETMRQTLDNYFPPQDSRKHLDEATGLPFRLTRAVNRKDLSEYKTVVSEYNDIIKAARREETMQAVLDSKHWLPLPLVQRILDQITARTVSPKTELLLQYKSFSSNTYGELLAPFNSQIFLDTKMDSSCVFLDLGSGVGNVVLQAALEIGCESHGIEMMPNPCELARAQAAEFPGRCRMWGLSHGKVNLLEGDFLEDARLPPIMQRVDVVLVNNVLFGSTLNENLTRLFLDLKDGARVVSLKSFVPEGWRLDERKRESILGMLEVEKKLFWGGCVSWTGTGGDYFVATKDTKRIERILGKTGGRRA